MSYAIKYTVPFQSISGIDYNVLIEVDGFTGTPTELIGGDEVFITEIDDSDVLTPIRSGTATLRVFGSNYLQDLYTSNPQGVRVKLMKDTELMWLGYMTPDTFSQDFSHPEFIYDIECVEALSTLKYKKFAETSDTITFIQLIKNAATLAGYNDMYLTASVCGTMNENIYETCSIACGNFYDELGEGMTYYEILEELAKYLVCSTFTAYKGKLYLLDYHAIRNSVNGYYHYDIAAQTAAESVTLQDVTTTHTLGYRGTGAKITRIAGKNKATVNCSLYEVENIIPEFDEEQSVFASMQEYTDSLTQAGKTTSWSGIVRRYNQPKFTFYKYEFGTNNALIITETNNALTETEIGTTFVRTASYDNANIPRKLTFDNEVLVRAWGDMSDYQNNPTKRIPYNTGKLITIKSPKVVLVNQSTYFTVNFSVKYISSLITMGAQGTDPFQPYQYSEFSADTVMRVPCKFRIGGYIYNGTSWEVVNVSNENMTFNIEFELKKDTKAYGTYFSVKNTNPYNLGIGDISGHLINPVPAITSGICEFVIYQPSGDDVTYGKIWKERYGYFKDIEIKYGQVNESAIYGDWIKEGSKNDLIYENEIDDDYIEEADEIDLKICTNTDGKLALSSVLSGGNYAGNMQSLSLAKTDIAEKLILEKVIDTFNTPRFQINPTIANLVCPYSLMTDEGLTGVTFVVCGGETDWKMDNTTVNLIQL